MEHWDQFSQKFLFQKSREVGKSFGWIWTQIPIQKKHETTTQTARIHESRAIGFRPSPWFFKIKWDDSDAPWIGLSPSTLMQGVNFWSPVVGHLLRTFPFFFIATWVLVLQRKFWRNVSGWRFGNTVRKYLAGKLHRDKTQFLSKVKQTRPTQWYTPIASWDYKGNLYVVFVLFSRYVTGGKVIL